MQTNSPPPVSSLRPKLRGEETTPVVETEVPALPVVDVGPEGWIVTAVLVVIFLILVLKRKSPKHLSEVEADEQPLSDVKARSRGYRGRSTQRRVARAGRSEDSTSPTINQPQKPTRISSAGKAWKDPEPFQADSAKRAQSHQIVNGTAFVTDGDTIVINKTQIRLFGIDAPELNHPYGQKAKWAMVKLCKGHKVRAEVTDIDHYGRTVARCYLPDGRDLSAELVKQGLAIDWPKFSGGVYTKLELPGIRKKLWLADARQKGRMFIWEKFEAAKR